MHRSQRLEVKVRKVFLILLFLSQVVFGQSTIMGHKYKTVFYDPDIETVHTWTDITTFDSSSLQINFTVGNEVELKLYDDSENIVYIQNLDGDIQRPGQAIHRAVCRRV